MDSRHRSALLIALVALVAFAGCAAPTPDRPVDPLVSCASLSGVAHYQPPATSTPTDTVLSTDPPMQLSGCSDQLGLGISSGTLAVALFLPGYHCGATPAPGTPWASGTGLITWSNGALSAIEVSLFGIQGGLFPIEMRVTGGQFTGSTARFDVRGSNVAGDCTHTPLEAASFSSTAPVVLHANDLPPRPALTGATQLALGDLHSCALRSDATVSCWGFNGFGQLMNSPFQDSDVAVTSQGIPAVTALAASVYHNCGVFVGGAGRCWAPLGVGMTGGATSPGAISTGNAHSCMILAGGGVRCQGDNSRGQLGDGSTTFSETGVDVVGPLDATALSAGFDFSCALLGDGTIRCWGANDAGQLGNGSTADSPVPVSVSGIEDAVAVSAGRSSACAVLGDGSVRCWGANDAGQLGDGSTTGASAPVTVSGLTGATAVGVGAQHTCAVVTDGDVRCWGANARGQLGSGTTDPSTTPVAVVGLTGATAVAAGARHTCAIVAGEEVRCWGDDSRGQLGNAATVNTPVTSPVTVVRNW